MLPTRPRSLPWTACLVTMTLLGAALGADPAEPVGYLGQSLVPGHLDPAGIGGIAWPGPLQGHGQTARAGDDFRCGPALGAKRASGRVVISYLHTNNAPVLDHGDSTAARATKRAIAG